MSNDMNEGAVFSIIVPVYNVSEYLRRCLSSLINQTFKDIEIILVDDGSKDDSSAICDEYAQIDSRVKVIHKENGGLSDARNKGLEAATGNYVIFVDSDDYIDTDACDKFLPYIEKSYDIIIGDAYVEGGKCNLTHVVTEDVMTGETYLLRALSAELASMAVWLNVYRREFLRDNGLNFKFGILHEDEQFTPRCLLKANTVVYSGVFFYHYIIRPSSITTKPDKRKNATDLYNTCLELEKIYNSLDNYKLKKLLKDSLVQKYLNMFQVGALYQYGKTYVHKKFIFRNAYKCRTRLKAMLYCLSPKLYYKINERSKRRNR